MKGHRTVNITVKTVQIFFFKFTLLEAGIEWDNLFYMRVTEWSWERASVSYCMYGEGFFFKRENVCVCHKII